MKFWCDLSKKMAMLLLLKSSLILCPIKSALKNSLLQPNFDKVSAKMSDK